MKFNMEDGRVVQLVPHITGVMNCDHCVFTKTDCSQKPVGLQKAVGDLCLEPGAGHFKLVGPRPIEDADGWIQWDGGKNPVPERSVVVEYKLRGHGDVRRELARYLRWQHGADPYDIVAYRVVKGDSQAVPPFPPPVAEATGDTKPTNPKDAVAGTKVPLDLLSPVAMAHWAAGQHAGNAKYGLVNYRVCGASARVYLGGALRHIQRYLAGETYDLQDGAHNLGMAMANLAIVLDCEAAGTLNDDRPYPVPLEATYQKVEEIVRDSNARYADRNPKHYTIKDAE